MKTINAWNADNRFARAYNSEGGSARIEHDIYLGKLGLGGDDFAATVGKWVGAMKEFEVHIDW